MKLCIDCKHFTPDKYAEDTQWGFCSVYTSPVDGKPYVKLAHEMRGLGDPRMPHMAQCGMDAKLFEPKEPVP